MDNIDKYTPSVRKAILSANAVSKSFGVKYVGSEQIIYGLILCADCRAAKLLAKYGVTKSAFFAELKKEISVGFECDGFTPNAKSMLEEAALIAYDSGLKYVATEHILLAVLRTECRACAIIRRLTANMRELQESTEREVFGFNSSAPVSPVSAEIGVSTQNLTANGGERPTNGNYYANSAGAFSQNESSAYKNGAKNGTESGAKNLAKNSESVKAGGENNPLSGFGVDITERAENGKLDPVIGREKEIARIVQTLSRRTKNSPVLVGEAGVGKSAVVEGLAIAIARGEVPENLAGKRIFSLDVSNLIAGASYRGEFEKRFTDAIEYVKNNPQIILFIDEIHNLTGAGASGEGHLDAAEMLKPALARGEFQLIGATTYDEYRKYIEKDPALERRFQPVAVEPPSSENAKIILKGLRDKYEAHHKVRITDEAISAAVDLSVRYITDRNLPDKAIDLIDETAAKARLKSSDYSQELNEKRAQLETATNDAAYYLREGLTEDAAEAERNRRLLMQEISEIQQRRLEKRSLARPIVTAEDVAATVSEITDIPLTKIEKSEAARLINLENELHSRVVGQEDAVRAVARAIRRARANLKDPNRPIGSFIFAGPTGVGKTELSKALAEAVFGDENAIIRVDMSEYMDRGSSSKLIGAAPGLVGYEEEGQLTGKVRKKPYSVVLFDEIEKAHPDIFDLMLQILDDGRLTDGKGKTVDFKNTVIIMTSNVGAQAVMRMPAFGFGGEEQKIENAALEQLKKQFRPEFLNRVDDIVYFRKLTYDECGKILEILLAGLKKRLLSNGIVLEIDDSAKTELLKRGYDEEYGARPLKRVVRREIEDMLSDELITGKLASGDKIVLYADETSGAIRYALI